MSEDLAAFHAALPPHIARAVTLDPTTIPAIHAATARIPPKELARICAKGVTRQHRNIRGVILHRLRREAGLNDQDGGDL